MNKLFDTISNPENHEEYIQVYNKDYDYLYVNMTTGVPYWTLPSNVSVDSITHMSHIADSNRIYYEDIHGSKTSWTLPNDMYSVGKANITAIQKMSRAQCETFLHEAYNDRLSMIQIDKFEEYIQFLEDGNDPNNFVSSVHRFSSDIESRNNSVLDSASKHTSKNDEYFDMNSSNSIVETSSSNSVSQLNSNDDDIDEDNPANNGEESGDDDDDNTAHQISQFDHSGKTNITIQDLKKFYIRRGTLTKQAVKSKRNWKKRHFVLTEYSLQYFENNFSTTAKGEYPISPDIAVEELGFVSNYDNCFHIFSKKGVGDDLLVAAATDQLRKEWIAAIDLAIDKSKQHTRGYVTRVSQSAMSMLMGNKPKYFILNQNILTCHPDEYTLSVVESVTVINSSTIIDEPDETKTEKRLIIRTSVVLELRFPKQGFDFLKWKNALTACLSSSEVQEPEISKKVTFNEPIDSKVNSPQQNETLKPMLFNFGQAWDSDEEDDEDEGEDRDEMFSSKSGIPSTFTKVTGPMSKNVSFTDQVKTPIRYDEIDNDELVDESLEVKSNMKIPNRPVDSSRQASSPSPPPPPPPPPSQNPSSSNKEIISFEQKDSKPNPLQQKRPTSTPVQRSERMVTNNTQQNTRSLFGKKNLEQLAAKIVSARSSMNKGEQEEEHTRNDIESKISDMVKNRVEGMNGPRDTSISPPRNTAQTVNLKSTWIKDSTPKDAFSYIKPEKILTVSSMDASSPTSSLPPPPPPLPSPMTSATSNPTFRKPVTTFISPMSLYQPPTDNSPSPVKVQTVFLNETKTMIDKVLKESGTSPRTPMKVISPKALSSPQASTSPRYDFQSLPSPHPQNPLSSPVPPPPPPNKLTSMLSASSQTDNLVYFSDPSHKNTYALLLAEREAVLQNIEKYAEYEKQCQERISASEAESLARIQSLEDESNRKLAEAKELFEEYKKITQASINSQYKEIEKEKEELKKERYRVEALASKRTSEVLKLSQTLQSKYQIVLKEMKDLAKQRFQVDLLIRQMTFMNQELYNAQYQNRLKQHSRLSTSASFVLPSTVAPSLPTPRESTRSIISDGSISGTSSKRSRSRSRDSSPSVNQKPFKTSLDRLDKTRAKPVQTFPFNNPASTLTHSKSFTNGSRSSNNTPTVSVDLKSFTINPSIGQAVGSVNKPDRNTSVIPPPPQSVSVIQSALVPPPPPPPPLMNAAQLHQMYGDDSDDDEYFNTDNEKVEEFQGSSSIVPFSSNNISRRGQGSLGVISPLFNSRL